MKSIILKTVTPLVFVLLTSFTAFAGGNEAFKTSVNLNEDANVIITLDGESQNHVEIKIYDASGEMVTYKRLMNTGTRMFRHMLSELPDGIYTYQVVEDGATVNMVRIVKEDNYSAEQHNMPEAATAAISQQDENEVIVRLANKIEGKAKIRLTDETGNLIDWRTVKDAENAKLTYDISKLPEGNYNLKVYNDSELIAFRKINK